MEQYGDNQIQAALAAMRSYQEKPFVSHEREELLASLNRINDPALKEILSREIEAVRLNHDFRVSCLEVEAA